MNAQAGSSSYAATANAHGSGSPPDNEQTQRAREESL